MRIDRRLARTATAALAVAALAGVTACGSGSPSRHQTSDSDFGSVAHGAGAASSSDPSSSPSPSHSPKPPPLKVASVTPASGTHDLSPTQALTVTFNRPVKKGSPGPSIRPHVDGAWSHPSDTSYVFTPSAPYPPDTELTATLPGGKLGMVGSHHSRLAGDVTEHWRVRGGSVLRVQQILARLGYLPLSFDSSAQPTSRAAEVAAAYQPPDGNFAWRWHPTQALSGLWAPGKRTVMTRGALIAYQHDRGLAVDGVVGRGVWSHLITDDLANRHAPHPYTYISTDLTLPQRLTVYSNGSPVITSPVNSGVAGARTPTGTWPIYARYKSITMSGTNPDGSHYRDPGVPWSNFFNGGDAVHGFHRPSYGHPQSVGCLELPVGTAHRVFDTVGYGTLVTTYGDPTRHHPAPKPSSSKPKPKPSASTSSPPAAPPSSTPPSAGPNPPSSPPPSTSPSGSASPSASPSSTTP